MERYREYKDSGIQWLGQIPGHWDCTSLGRVLSEKLQYGASESGDLECTNDSMRYIRITDITLDGKLKTNGCKFLPSEIGRNYPVKKGDVLLARSGATVGKAFIYNEDVDACYAGYLIKASVKQENVSPQFFFYFTQTSQYDEWKNRIFIQATIQNISAEKYARMSLCIPPLSEQLSIVSYLDDKCGKIDKMLEGKQKQIELLEEMKQRIIADAVTRGLNPNVKMKATNIPWLPEIPEHWECVKLKAFCKENKEKNKDNTETCVLSLSYGRIIIKRDTNIGLVPTNYENYQIVNPGNIVLRLTDLQNDHKSLRTGLVKNHGIITSAYVGLIVNVMSSEYVQLVLHSYDIKKIFYGMGGGLRQSMNYQDISNLYIPVPPTAEQRSIVSYINERSSMIDILTQKLQQEIESIKEYKQRLISDVVTGQIKVC